MSCTTSMLAGRYRLAEQVAVGGIGEVWRGLDVVLERPVAIKLLRAEHAGNPEALARFRAEARHAGSVSHPGITQIHDYGDADPPHPPYLVMELVDGQSLAVLLAGGPLDPAHAMDVVAQTAAGLHAAHLAGLVHRDIKPGNLLITRDGHVKITDFGIAHVAGSSPVTTGMLVGTPAYLAPERVAGTEATPASDVYSLGIVAYECLVGVPPFSGTPVEVALAHRQRPVPPLPASVRSEVAALVTELTAKDESARPGSADEVARRAGLLRDRLAGGPALPTGARADPLAATLTDMPLPTPPPAQLRLPGGRRLPGRAALLAGIAAVAASLLGLLLAGALASASPGRQLAARPASQPAAAVRMVEVNGDPLAGQPVDAVRVQLRQRGLRVRVLWQPSRDQPGGTVLSVQPSGRVPAGSVVTVTAARQAGVFGQVNGHDHGDGGNGGGDGGGGGGQGGGD